MPRDLTKSSYCSALISRGPSRNGHDTEPLYVRHGGAALEQGGKSSAEASLPLHAPTSSTKATKATSGHIQRYGLMGAMDTNGSGRDGT